MVSSDFVEPISRPTPRRGDPMSESDPGITLGIEEEFFLVAHGTRDLLSDPDRRIFETCERNRGPHNAVPEFLRSQIETGRKVCRSVAEAREALGETGGWSSRRRPGTAPP